MDQKYRKYPEIQPGPARSTVLDSGKEPGMARPGISGISSKPVISAETSVLASGISPVNTISGFLRNCKTRQNPDPITKVDGLVEIVSFVGYLWSTIP